MLIDPLQGWRTVNVTERRTGRDVAGRVDIVHNYSCTDVTVVLAEDSHIITVSDGSFINQIMELQMGRTIVHI